MKLEYTIKDNQYVIIGDEENRYKVLQIDDSNLGNCQMLFNSYLSLLANEHDLKYAKEYIDQMFFSDGTTLIDGALINSAIQLFVKCFTNPAGKGRSQLNEKKVFNTYAQSIGKKNYLAQYYQFYNARRHSLAHDEDDYKDNIVGVTIDTQDGNPLEISYIRVRPRFLYKQNADLLKEMIVITLEFIKIKKQQIENKLIEHYKEKPNSEIAQYSALDCKGIDFSNSW